jgi:diguanylate cyclase (GGDEF)-like protein
LADLSVFLNTPALDVIEFTPLVFAATSLLTVWALASRRVFRIEPAALELAFEGLQDGVLILDRFGRVAQLNAAAKRLVRHDSSEMDSTDLIGELVENVLIGWPSNALETQTPQMLEVNPPGTDQHLQYNQTSLVGGGFAVIVRDVSELRRHQLSILKGALSDPLTGLANRRALFERGERALEAARRDGRELFVAYLDLDGFKPVNDRLGHEHGDVLLRAVAQRLEQSVGQVAGHCVVRAVVQGAESEGLVARVGGDEFVILFERTDRASVETWLALFENTMIEPFSLTAESVRVGASVGLASYPNHGDSLEELLRVTDGEMYRDKQLKSRWRQTQVQLRQR